MSREQGRAAASGASTEEQLPPHEVHRLAQAVGTGRVLPLPRGCQQVWPSPPSPPHLQPTDDFPQRKSRLVSADEGGCGQVEDLVEVRFIQPVKAYRSFHGWDKQKRERGKGNRTVGHHCAGTRVGKGQKKAA